MMAALASRAEVLRSEIKRISNVTLSGNFSNLEDRRYWVDRLRKLNSELHSIEERMRPARIQKGTK